MPVKFEDYSVKVKAALNDTTIAWLHTWASEAEAQAKRNVSSQGWSSAERSQLRGSYANMVDESKGEATIGTPLEQGYWEEFGTGEYADTSKNGGKPGRRGWWVYKDGYKGNGGEILTEAEAKAIAAGDPKLHATNGRRPSYTLENAFNFVKPKAIADLKEQLKEKMEK
jgi:hypothetical protein